MPLHLLLRQASQWDVPATIAAMQVTKLLTAQPRRLPPAMRAMKKATLARTARLVLPRALSPAAVAKSAIVATNPVTSHVTAL